MYEFTPVFLIRYTVAKIPPWERHKKCLPLLLRSPRPSYDSTKVLVGEPMSLLGLLTEQCMWEILTRSMDDLKQLHWKISTHHRWWLCHGCIDGAPLVLSYLCALAPPWSHMKSGRKHTTGSEECLDTQVRVWWPSFLLMSCVLKFTSPAMIIGCKWAQLTWQKWHQFRWEE